MCDKLHYNNPRIDACLREKIRGINQNTPFKTIASCCGHGKYPTTIVVRDKSGKIHEYFSGVPLEKKKRNRYYKRDSEGYYYIPEVVDKTNKVIDALYGRFEEKLKKHQERDIN